jgi:predicted RNA-binding protein with PIN domain
MAYLLIDGYNLIGTAHNNLEKARSDIIEKLISFSEQRGHAITIVFDGWKEGRKEEIRTRLSNVQVIYSPLGVRADTVIMRILSVEIRPWIVVSSDREIADYADKKEYVCLTAEEFENVVDYYLDEKAEDISLVDEEIDSVPFYRKGKSYTVPKKHRKKIQALKKL